ncbi:MAG: HD-like signal output (HDOD) protein [Cellvibrionaceae bacterium]|jgi:HD-like signal output (HDOD) protein
MSPEAIITAALLLIQRLFCHRRVNFRLPFAATGKVDVPVSPETAHCVMMLTQDTGSDAAQLANIIQSDPTMGSHVMRIGNSAAYTPNSNLVSIQQAVARLSILEISNIALSTSLDSKMFNAPGYEQTIAIIWQHAVAADLWSKEVARSMRSIVEAAFFMWSTPQHR